MSVFRYVVLAAPAAACGLWLAPRLHVSQVLGLVGGLVTATAISSLVFLIWTRKALIDAAKGAQDPSAAA